MLKKATGGHVKDVDREGRTIVALVSVFGNEDADGDVITRGAYEETIRALGPAGKDRVWHLVDHDPTKRINKPDRIEETDSGLLFETAVPETRLGDDVLALYDAVGESMEHSVKIEILDSEPRDPMSDADNATLLTRLKLWEGSTVTWGANERARLQEMKSDADLAESDVLTRHAERLRTLLKSDLSEGLFDALENELHAIEQHVQLLSKLHNEKQNLSGADSGRARERELEIARRLKRRIALNDLANKIDTL